MATVDDLSVRVSASTADFTAGMNTAESALSDLRSDAMQTAGSMQVLQGRMDEAGDEAQTAGTKAGASSGGFLALASSAATTKISFSSLSVVTATSLIPAMLTLSTVMAPLLAAMGGFVTVAAAITGVGLIGFLGAATQRSDQLKSNFQELRSTLLNALAPAFDIFAGVLNRLMAHLTDTINEMSVSESVIRRIAGQFEQMGIAIIDTLPAFVQLAVTLTDRFLPPFVDLVQNVLPKAPGFFRSLVSVMQDVWTTVRPLAAAISNLRPQITGFGMVVLNTIVPVLTTLVNVFGTVLTRLRQTDTETQRLVATATILLPIVSGIATVLGGPLIGAIGTLATTLGGPLLTGLLAIVGGFSSLAGILVTLAPSLTGIAATLSALSPSLAGMVGVVVSIATAFGSFSGILATVSGTLVSVAATLSTLSPALAGVIGVAITATSTFAGLLGPLAGVVSTTGGLITTLGALLGPIGLVVAAIGTFGYALKTNRKVISRFANRAITLLQNVIRDAATWIKNNGPGLVKEAFRLVGEGIRFVALDIYNAITGNNDSILRSIIVDFGSWLINKGPGILKSAAKTAFNVIMAAARGLYEGLIGNSLFPEMFQDIATYIKSTGKELLTGAIDTVVEAITGAFDYVTGTGSDSLLGDVKSALGTITDWIKNIWDIAGAIADAFKGAGEAASSAFKSAFNSALPDSVGTGKIKAPGGKVISDGVNIDLPELDTGGMIQEEGMYVGHAGERVLNPAETERLQELEAGGGTQEVDVKVNFDVDGEGPMADFVKEKAELTIEQKERRTMRNSGRNLSPR